MLALVASPTDRPHLDIDREQQRVDEATRILQDKGHLEVHWLKDATRRDLVTALQQGPWHIFHFVGHGGFDRQSDEGIVALVDEHGATAKLAAKDLARVLGDHMPLRLVVLNACEGAKGSDHDLFSSTAASILRFGTPAVVAMQYEIDGRGGDRVQSSVLPGGRRRQPGRCRDVGSPPGHGRQQDAGMGDAGPVHALARRAHLRYPADGALEAAPRDQDACQDGSCSACRRANCACVGGRRARDCGGTRRCEHVGARAHRGDRGPRRTHTRRGGPGLHVRGAHTPRLERSDRHGATCRRRNGPSRWCRRVHPDPVRTRWQGRLVGVGPARRRTRGAVPVVCRPPEACRVAVAAPLPVAVTVTLPVAVTVTLPVAVTVTLPVAVTVTDPDGAGGRH